MKKMACLAPFLALTACAGYEKVPETGRTRPKLQYSEEEMEVLGAEAYQEVTKDYVVIHGTPDAQMVEDVAKRIAKATGKNYDWQFKLLEAPDTVNAFCLPGGKIAVFSGILPLCQGENGLAVVLGHEVAHATLQHGSERMSEPAIKRLITFPVRLTVGLWQAMSPGTQDVVLGSLGLGYVVAKFMPYSQEHEIEADEVGLRYMQKAGFDIREAPEFWTRMAKAYPDRQDSNPMSTHPTSVERSSRLKKLVSQMEAEEAKKKEDRP